MKKIIRLTRPARRITGQLIEDAAMVVFNEEIMPGFLQRQPEQGRALVLYQEGLRMVRGLEKHAEDIADEDVWETMCKATLADLYYKGLLKSTRLYFSKHTRYEDAFSGVHWWLLPGGLTDEEVLAWLEREGVNPDGHRPALGPYDCTGQYLSYPVRITRTKSRTLVVQCFGHDV